jgi:hypothetical protein
MFYRESQVRQHYEHVPGTRGLRSVGAATTLVGGTHVLGLFGRFRAELLACNQALDLRQKSKGKCGDGFDIALLQNFPRDASSRHVRLLIHLASSLHIDSPVV